MSAPLDRSMGAGKAMNGGVSSHSLLWGYAKPMKKLILAAGVAAFAISAPAYAGPGKGHGKQAHKAAQVHAKGHKSHKGHKGHGDAFGRTAGTPFGYGMNGCPPGLAKKPQCMPPGQYKKQFELGQRVPLGYKGLLGYNSLPYQMRSQYGSALDPRSRYIYDNSYLYRVDPTTMVVQQVLGALIR